MCVFEEDSEVPTPPEYTFTLWNHFTVSDQFLLGAPPFPRSLPPRTLDGPHSLLLYEVKIAAVTTFPLWSLIKRRTAEWQYVILS